MPALRRLRVAAKQVGLGCSPMTEAEWLTCNDVVELFESLNRRNGSARKFRLLACACCRHIWHLMTFSSSRESVELAEQYADGLVDLATLDLICERVDEAIRPLIRIDRSRSDIWAALVANKATWTDPRNNHGNAEGCGYVFTDLVTAVMCAEVPLADQDQEAEWRIGDREYPVMAGLLRDIFGNPFRPVTFDPDWRTSTVVSLARQMYDSRDFSPMPILADALQDAGCDNDDILAHCRDANATHVRGCWVVDLVLGKS